MPVASSFPLPPFSLLITCETCDLLNEHRFTLCPHVAAGEQVNDFTGSRITGRNNNAASAEKRGRNRKAPT